MGTSSSKSKKKYAGCELYSNSKHCCLGDCFSKIKNVEQLNHVSNILWLFTDKHENELRKFLKQYQLDDLTEIIMSYLNNLKSTQYTHNDGSNYNLFIRTAISALNGDNSDENKICPIWMEHSTENNSSYYKTKNVITCVMVGAGVVGKTALTLKFMTDEFLEEIDPTIEDSYIKAFPLNVDMEDIDKYIYDPMHPNSYYMTGNESQDETLTLKYKYKDIQQVTLDILDTAGREEFSAMLDQWFREGSIFFLVFDVMQQVTFEEIQLIWERIIRSKDPIWDKQHNKTDFGVIAVGNKCDLREDKSYKPYRGRHAVDMKNANEWFKEKKIPYIETSAKNGRNVNFLFRHSVYEYWLQSHTGCVSYE